MLELLDRKVVSEEATWFALGRRETVMQIHGRQKKRLNNVLLWRLGVVVVSLIVQIVVICAILISLQQPAQRSVAFAPVPGDVTACRIASVTPFTDAWLKRVPIGTLVRAENISTQPLNCATLSGSLRLQTPSTETRLHVSPTFPSVDITTIVLVSILTIIFDLAGITIFLRGQDRPTAHVAYGLFYTTSLMFSAAIAYGYDYLWINVLIFMLSVIVRGLSTTFICLFPRPITWQSRRKSTRWLPYAPFGIGIGIILIFPLIFLFPRGQLILFCTFVYNAACLIVAVWVLFWGLRNVNKNERQLARMIVLGVVFLLSMLAFGLNIVQIDNVAQVSLTRLLIIPLLVLPIVCDYALFRHQLLGTTSLISRQVIRVLLWLLLVSLFVFPSVILLSMLRGAESTQGELFGYVYAALFAFSVWLFPILWRKVRDAGDQVLYHDFYQYNHSLRELSAALTHLQGLDQICSFILPRLTTLLNASDIALLVRDTSSPLLIHSKSSSTWQLYRQQTPVTALTDERLRGVAQLALTHTRISTHEPLLLDNILLLGLHDENHVTGFLCLGPKKNIEPYNRQDRSFLATLVAQLSVLEVNNRYLSQAQADAQKLSALNHRVVSAQEDERKHLALELHDEALQQAMLLVRQLSDASTMTEVAEAMPLARSIVTSLRQTCLELRPPLLDELGLEEALHWLARETEKRGKLQIQVSCKGTLDIRPSVAIELAVYRVVQEALSNVLKHANAHTVVIRLRQHACGKSSLVICDDGRGFQRRSLIAERLGLVSMHERMEAIGGHIHVRTSLGRGVTIRATYQQFKQSGVVRPQEAVR